jgi:hypothetical protein
MAGLAPAIQSRKHWRLLPWMGGSRPPMVRMDMFFEIEAGFA